MKRSHTRNLTISAILAIISIILTRFLPTTIPIAGVISIRLDFGYIPIIFAALYLGGLYGAGAGVVADLIGAFVFPIGPYFPGFTLTNFLVGIVPVLIKKILSKVSSELLICFISSIFIQIIAFVLNTLWLILLYSQSFALIALPRALASIIMIPVLTFSSYYLIKLSKRLRL
ncbi:MAG: folate family ECF transporter S component [Ruminococcaceae bacterium]|nr:folate family ECF transporter S component [Oscillospiraceae bacterium]